MKLRAVLLASLGLYFSSLNASSDPCFCNGRQIYIGPEIYHVKRTREEGAKQRGWMYGGRLEFEYLQRYKFYAGADALWAKGTLDGISGGDSKVKSKLTDENLEARFGYTFQRKHGWKVGITPFTGWGHFWEDNCFVPPSARTVSFKNHFSYVPLGFILQITPCPNWRIYIKYKIRYLLSGVINVRDTTEEEEVKFKMHYQEKLHYRLDIPIMYQFYFCNLNMFAVVDPFYETRRYGRLSNFPFDFYDTKFRIYGVNLSLMYNF